MSELDEKKKRKKAGTESSKESSLRDWFKRKGAKGKKGGWVDCNAPDGKGGYKSCGRSSGEKRKKYPACRPTPGACKERGRGKSWGKKGSKKKRNENMQLTTEQIKKIIQEELTNVLMESDVIKGIEKLESSMFDPKVDEVAREHYRNQFRELISSGDPEVTEWANSRIAEIDEEIEPLEAEIEKLFAAAESDDYYALESGMEAQDKVDFELRPLLDKKKLYQPMSLQEKKGSKRQRKKKAKKDACYHKVKSRYKVWPSAYASGALTKCRKVGAKNWGNKSKKNESLDEEFIPGGESSKYGQITTEAMIVAIADEHGVSPEDIRKEFEMGVEEEMEHAQEEAIAQEIALDHLVEDPKYYSKLEGANLQEFKKHDMFDPKTGKKKVAKVEKDHHDLAKKGYTHIDPQDIIDLIDKEGGALGLKNLIDKFGKEQEEEILKTLKAMDDVGQHEEGDYIRADDKEIDVVKEAEMEEAKKKKPCKPAKGKRFAKRVNGKCRSFGQAGKAKGGGDRIRPGTKKGDAYCARSAKIKKCKNPPCANDLSRKKWKCRGSKSMREEKGE